MPGEHAHLHDDNQQRRRQDASGVIVTDTLPANTNFVSAPMAVSSPAAWSPGTSAPGRAHAASHAHRDRPGEQHRGRRRELTDQQRAAPPTTAPRGPTRPRQQHGHRHRHPGRRPRPGR